MTTRRFPWPVAFITVGLLGLSLFLLGNRYQWGIIPTSDFARGLWFGVCLGSELLGVILMAKAMTRAKPSS